MEKLRLKVAGGVMDKHSGAPRGVAGKPMVEESNGGSLDLGGISPGQKYKVARLSACLQPKL